MAVLKRICVPLSLDCNLNCKYCYRDHDSRIDVPAFSEGMVKYLGGLSPDRCECVCASGGEPLVHWDRVKELFSYVPKDVHKKIMTNGTLLTQEIVDYVNDNDIELSVSHDGPKAEFLRGVDILKDERIAGLVRQVKILRMVCVITKFNPDVWENFFDTAKRLGRCEFNYYISPLLDCPEQEYLVDGMDYDKWFRTWTQFFVSPYHLQLPWYFGRTLKKTASANPVKYRYGKHGHFNVLPDGRICEMRKITADYGKVWDEFTDLYGEMLKNEVFAYCAGCEYNKKCNINIPCYSAHTYKIRTMSNSFLTNPEKRAEVRRYVLDHLHDIEREYGVDRAEIGADYV